MLYDFSSYLIAAVLLVLMLVTMWLCGAIGRQRQTTANGDSKSQANTVQGALLGLLALLLGFTFSLSLGRYVLRSAEVVEEANAIGTAWLRTDLVSEARRDETKALLRDYGPWRREAAEISAGNDAARARGPAEA